jgi:hypothetical protein
VCCVARLPLPRSASAVTLPASAALISWTTAFSNMANCLGDMPSG